MIIKDKYIYKFETILSDEDCDSIYQYFQSHCSKMENDISKLPWFEGNTEYWRNLVHSPVGPIIAKARDLIHEKVQESYEQKVYPNVTVLTLWKEGKSMPFHKDNGYDDDKETLHMREYTAVLYLNDDFLGGETEIQKEGSCEIEYTCIPKKGTLILFKSDESCLHSVKQVLWGERLALTMWFTSDEQYIELF